MENLATVILEGNRIAAIKKSGSLEIYKVFPGRTEPVSIASFSTVDSQKLLDLLIGLSAQQCVKPTYGTSGNAQDVDESEWTANNHT